ncbi:MAG: phosphotransferase family protein [Paracoccaceae bacterium]|nr:phosphotransferase family protein [Paracoccaceae bacterium]
MQNVDAQIKALPCFKDAHDLTPLSGGLTNVNVLVHDQGQKYVVRLGADIPEHGVMRWNELAISKAASCAGLSPKVVYSAPGVSVFEFVEGLTYTEEDVRDTAKLERLVDFVGTTHRTLGTHLTEPVMAFWPFHVNRFYLAQLDRDRSSHHMLLLELFAQNEKLEAAVGKVDLVVGHNDLLAANFIDDGDRLWLIDWEYGGLNSPLFDLAGLASNNALSEAQERAVLAQYFGADCEAHLQSYAAMKCSSLLRETLWSMTSEIHSELEEDFAGYTAKNIEKLTSALADFEHT